MKYTKCIIAAVVVVAAIGGGFYYYQSSGTKTTAVVKTVKVERSDIVSAVAATGTIKPVNMVDISSKITGLIRELKVQENDTIKTFRKSTVQIRLNDNTIIKIGQKTTLNIEKYLYDTQNKGNNTANLKIENGSFQIKTGSIGDDAPSNFKIKTKFSTIGLRG